ncbi:MAG: M48 family metallopeptidase [Elusimicrobia bacterium]|nr:M48 family metallopeptidase [Elusimicrobiota bacterium]
MPEIKIIKESRKTIAITVLDDKTVLVKAPRYAGQKFIDDFIKSKEKWLAKNLKEISAFARPHKRQFENGEMFLFLGSSYPLQIERAGAKGLAFNGEKFIIALSRIKNAKTLFNNFYKLQTQRILDERLPYFIGLLNNANGFFSFFLDVKYKNVKVVNSYNQLGACTKNGDLRFSFRLSIMPPEIIDYVIAHEIVHLKHFNHSPKFWQELEKVLPNYKQAKEYLRKNHALMLF